MYFFLITIFRLAKPAFFRFTDVNPLFFSPFFERGEASAKRAWTWSATVEDIRVSRSRPASCSPEKRAKIAPVLQAIAPVIVLVTQRSWGQEQKVEPSKNLTCDQAFFFSRNGITRKSANEEREKENAVFFSSPPKQKRKKGRLTVVYQKSKKATE